MFVRILASFILLGVATSFNVNAASHGAADNGINYTYGELRFVDVDGGDGIEIGGSYRINQDIYLLASYQDLDLGPFNFNVEFLEFGGGYIIPHKNIDFAAEFTIISADFNGASENGYSLSGGGRSYLTPEFEARVFARRIDDGNNSDTFIELGGDYFLSSDLSVGISLEVASESDALTFGARLYF